MWKLENIKIINYLKCVDCVAYFSVTNPVDRYRFFTIDEGSYKLLEILAFLCILLVTDDYVSLYCIVEDFLEWFEH